MNYARDLEGKHQLRFGLHPGLGLSGNEGGENQLPAIASERFEPDPLQESRRGRPERGSGRSNRKRLRIRKRKMDYAAGRRFREGANRIYALGRDRKSTRLNSSHRT